MKFNPDHFKTRLGAKDLNVERDVVHIAEKVFWEKC